MKVIGVRKVSFDGRDRDTGKKTGEKIEGFNIYYSEPISDKVGTGDSADRFFMTDKRMEQLGYYPKVGDEIRLLYNRYGKIESVELV